MTDLDKARAIAAHGGMTEFYQAANAKFQFSERLSHRDSEPPSDEARLSWLRDTIQLLQGQFARQLYLENDYDAAYMSRQIIGTLLDEMEPLLEQS